MPINGVKIVTIGGGSSYTPELIEGFIKRKDELPIREIWLVDIEEGKEKLEIVGNLAKRMIKKANLDWELHTTLDREEALKDADFVTKKLNQYKEKAILPAGFEDDWNYEGPPRYDYHLARLIWLEYWMQWAVKNCDTPAIWNT